MTAGSALSCVELLGDLLEGRVGGQAPVERRPSRPPRRRAACRRRRRPRRDRRRPAPSPGPGVRPVCSMKCSTCSPTSRAHARGDRLAVDDRGAHADRCYALPAQIGRCAAQRRLTGAYSAISLRSEPSPAKRTTITPSGLHARDDAVAEGRVDDVLAEAELRPLGRRLAPRRLRPAGVGLPAGDRLPAGATDRPRRRQARLPAQTLCHRLVEQVGRDLVQEAAAQAVGLRAEHGAAARVGQVQLGASPA